MHRFQPRIYLVVRPLDASGPIVDLEKEFYRSYIFPETIFTAVTAYQNQLVSAQIYTGNIIHARISSKNKAIFCGRRSNFNQFLSTLRFERRRRGE